MTTERNPWPALYALVIGFFMILLDTTIVAVANPVIMADLDTSISNVIWVTSAYLLTYAVPLLVSGRLGDRFGPKNMYLLGLAVFTLASLGCGLAGSIGVLIAARAVQGLGAALMNPQTMSVITRTFPPDKRGAAMGLWGGVAGLATLVGPILGGVLVDNVGWQWIFYVNVPVGAVAFVAAAWLVPALPTSAHKFDIPGVIMSGIGLTALVYGLQQGNSYHWAGWVWGLIAGGIVVLGGFLVYQGRTVSEPLMPLRLFKDRNFTLSSVAVMSMGASITAFMLPTFFFLQVVLGFSPTKAGLVLAPMPVVTGFLAPILGRISDQLNVRIIPTFGFVLFAGTLAWFATLVKPETSVAALMLPMALSGVANACIWPPLAAIATHNLPMQLAGAGSGVFNEMRQVGAVIGSAAMSALVTARLAAHGIEGGGAPAGANTKLPAALVHPFSSALGDSMYLPVAILIIGIVASFLFASRPGGTVVASTPLEETNVDRS
ncbi:DHA2 family efflux MFS transporter permease subunit [Antrihabitans cavernicola]|uniref:DHA2 family efflux MFS transporter permease subunit n=1 Tax=Antrihabitans cavernicola TaxID=2495913 RepID=A0A5A7SI47_9NOCA|nr:DHA2 family efflux MFS transporter permease subunit [Spelaeibacter cavernicola]KAA0024165.1 DHA2 family efflux MFS transporter permease subunit [Spelaeibacter cavernicola]